MRNQDWKKTSMKSTIRTIKHINRLKYFADCLLVEGRFEEAFEFTECAKKKYKRMRERFDRQERFGDDEF